MFDRRLKMCEQALAGSPCARCKSTISRHESRLTPPSSRLSRSALTLIELLVVIVILTTLVAGVVPILSPNNDARKIREAGRGLQSYITVAQSKAARTGSPAGIAFRESALASGVALEVFQLEVPKGFSGFSENSRCRVTPGIIGVYGSGGNGGTRFSARYDGWHLRGITFWLATGAGGNIDAFPPRMFRVGDVIDVEGNLFLIVDDGDEVSAPNQLKAYPKSSPPEEQTLYLEPPYAGPNQQIVCIWLNEAGGQLPPQGQKTYKILRQPVNSSESPYQLPAGVVIDMQGSVTEGNPTPTRFPIGESLFEPGLTNTVNTVGIMFSPTGSVSNIFLNGNRLTAVSRVVLLLGRIENAGIDPTITPLPWVWQTGVEIEEIQAKINWLNLDSRLLSIVSRSGRTVVSELAFVDPSLPANVSSTNDDFETAALQIEAAHQFSHEMKRGGGR